MENQAPIKVPDAEPIAGVLPTYLDLVKSCRSAVVPQYAELFLDLFEQLDNFMLTLAETAETNAARSHYFEVMHDLLVQQAQIKRKFATELERGFDNFVQGTAEPLRAPFIERKERLSLIDKDEYEISLAYNEVVRRTNELLGEQLLALNHRLAVLNGGRKLGEFHPALPGSPAQVCDAMQTALQELTITVASHVRVRLAEEFERRVMQRAAPVYDQFNQLLIDAGILPNLCLESLEYQPPVPPRPAAAQTAVEPSPPSPVEAESAVEEAAPEDQASQGDYQLFRGIQELLATRHVAPQSHGPVQATAPADLAALLGSLTTLQNRMPPVQHMPFGQSSLEEIKATFAEHVAQLHTLVREQRIAEPDADLIDLVGMLFEFILNDNGLPDSVKALISHLHTPFLKVAILDRKFFFQSKHPARRLLNVLTQAGTQCHDDADGQGIFTKMREVVERIVREFEDDTGLFEVVLQDFSEFLDSFNRRARAAEKRSVETARGRERLREARQVVSGEIIDRTWDRSIPKAAERLITGAWADLLVLIYLRQGTESDDWRDMLAVVDDIVWSVEPKATAAEQRLLREKLPRLEQAVRNGLTMIGDPDINIRQLLDDLGAQHRRLLATEAAAPETAPPPAGRPTEVLPAPPEIRASQAIWDDIEPPPEPPAKAEGNSELEDIVRMLKTVKLGVWFEFAQPGNTARKRAKLSWYSAKTAYYIFVDQAGLQVAVKSLRALSREIADGEARLLPQPRKPFMERALEAVHSVLAQRSDDHART